MNEPVIGFRYLDRFEKRNDECQQLGPPADGAVIVPGGTAHTFWNLRPDPARYLLIMGARTFALIQAIHATDDRSPPACGSYMPPTAPRSSAEFLIIPPGRKPREGKALPWGTKQT